eukprot:COSAG06_NODE_2346_length_7010_cov_15.299207_1_plen_56_part_10
MNETRGAGKSCCLLSALLCRSLNFCEQPAVRPAAVLALLSCSQPTPPAALRDAAPS